MWPKSGLFGGVAEATQGLQSLTNVNYSSHVIEVRQTEEFEDWHTALRDARAARKISERIFRLQSGLFGDVKYFSGIGELRIDYGPGYRLYFTKRNDVLILLLCGGDKSSQKRDIKTAIKLAEEY